MTLVDVIRELQLDEAKNPAQQAAIAIAKKEKGEEPKKEEAEKCEECGEVHEGECDSVEESISAETEKDIAKAMSGIKHTVSKDKDKANYKVKVDKKDVAKATGALKGHPMHKQGRIQVVTEEVEEVEEGYKTPAEAQALADGKKAARKGKKYSDNPHKKGSKEHTAWSKGHNMQREEVELDEAFETLFEEEIDTALEESKEDMSKHFGGFDHSQSVLDAIMDVVEGKMDKVDKKALKKDFDDRKDKDIDNDGDVDSSDEYLHKRRKAVSKAVDKEDGDENADEKKVKAEKEKDLEKKGSKKQEPVDTQPVLDEKTK